MRTNAIANVLILAFGTPAAYLLATPALPGRALRDHADRAAARAAARGGRDRAAGRVRRRRAVRRRAAGRRDRAAVHRVGGRAGGRLRRRRRSTCARRSARSRASTRRCTTPRARSAPPRRARSCAIALPLAASGLVAGWVLAFARGIGEFGATIVFAGNVRGETETLTLTIYEQLEASFDVALSIGILLVVISAVVLLSYKLLARGAARARPHRPPSHVRAPRPPDGRRRDVRARRAERGGQVHDPAPRRGLEAPDAGRIALGDDVWFDGARKVNRAPDRRSVGLVFQEYALFPHMTVAQNVAFGGASRRGSASCSSASGIGHLAREKPTRLSGGERQRVARGPRARPRPRPCCCSTSRCRRWTPTRAPPSASELADILARAGDPDADRHPRLPRRQHARRPRSA